MNQSFEFNQDNIGEFKGDKKLDNIFNKDI